MKKLINVNDNSTATDVSLLLLRIGIASLMLTHGLQKMELLFSGNPVQFPPVMGMSGTVSLALAVFAEVFCSVLVLTGFLTRLAVIPLAFTMFTAVFFIHAADPFGKKELAVIYLLVYAVLFLSGSGRFSLDFLLQQKPAKQNINTAFANA